MRFSSPFARRFALAWLVVMHAAVTAAPTFADFIYGIDNANNIQEINTATQTATQVYTNSPGGTIPAGSSNAFAYDTARDQFFFIDSQNNLEFWTRSGNPSTLATADDLGLMAADPADQPRNAAFYNDAYWFYYEGTNTLNKLSFTYSGGLPGSPTLDSFNIVQTSGGVGLPASWTNTFGDIAINATTGILYGATQSGVLYSVDLNTLNTPPTNAVSITGGLPSLQLSFSSDYSTLYGQDFNNGQWYTINTSTGAATAIPGFTILFTGGEGLLDLGGAASSAAVPEIDPASFGSVLVLLLGAFGLVERRSLRRPTLAGIA